MLPQVGVNDQNGDEVAQLLRLGGREKPPGQRRRRARNRSQRRHRRCLGKKAWNRCSAGDGAKGRRDYDWAWVAVIPPADEATGFHWLLIRRRISDGELAFYRCHAPTRVALPALVRVAGARWAADAHNRPDTQPAQLIGLTINEIRRLFNLLIIQPRRDLAHRLHWSHWRRRHQATARRIHYQQRCRNGTDNGRRTRPTTVCPHPNRARPRPRPPRPAT